MNGKLEKRMKDEFKDEKEVLAKTLNYNEKVTPQHENQSIMEYFVSKTIELDNINEKTFKTDSDSDNIERLEKTSLFFESGSSLAYLGFHLINNDSFGHKIIQENEILRVTTNNILIDHTFVFEQNISVNLIEGTPIGKYGATFGFGIPVEEPDNIIKPYRKGDEKFFEQFSKKYVPFKFYYKKMKDYIDDFFFRFGNPSFLLMTTSGLSLIDGLHVGSFQNRDFKECMYEYAVKHKIPYVIIIFDDKIESSEINIYECLRIFGEDGQSIGHSENISGFNFLVKAISRGEIILIVTKKDGYPEGIGGEGSSNSGKLFRKIKNIVPNKDLELSSYGVEVLESPLRKVRIFCGHEKGLENNNIDSNYIRVVKDLKKFGYGVYEKIWI